MNPTTLSGKTGLPLHVVIVEDNVDANNLMRDWLKLQFSVTCFLDAEATLRIFPPSTEPFVFLIDYNLPGDNGMILKNKLMSRFPKAKYILISGLFDEKLIRETKAAGFSGYLSKPFGMTALTQKIEEVSGLNQKQSLMQMVRGEQD